MREVRYLEEAQAEFLHEIDYFSKISLRLAERFDQAIEKAEVRAVAPFKRRPGYWKGRVAA